MSDIKYELIIPEDIKSLHWVYIKDLGGIGMSKQKCIIRKACGDETYISFIEADCAFVETDEYKVRTDWLVEIKVPMSLEECNEKFGFEQEYYDVLQTIESKSNSGFTEKWIRLIKKEREKFWNAALENDKIRRGEV